MVSIVLRVRKLLALMIELKVNGASKGIIATAGLWHNAPKAHIRIDLDKPIACRVLLDTIVPMMEQSLPRNVPLRSIVLRILLSL